MRSSILMAGILLTAILVSGCTQVPPEDQTGDQNPPTDQQGDQNEQAAYDQLEQELDQAVEDLDLGDLEGELLN